MKDEDDFLSFIQKTTGGAYRQPPTPAPRRVAKPPTGSIQVPILDPSNLNVQKALKGDPKADEMTEEELTVGMKDTLAEMEEFTRVLLRDLDSFGKHHKKAKISSSDLHSRLTELHSTIEQLVADAPDLLDSALYGNITNAAIDDLRKWIESEAQ